MTTLEQWNVAQTSSPGTKRRCLLTTDHERRIVSSELCRRELSVLLLTAVIGAVRNCETSSYARGRWWCRFARGSALHERVLGSLLYCQVQPCGRRQRDESTVERQGRGARIQGILDASQRAAAFYAKGGAKVWNRRRDAKS